MRISDWSSDVCSSDLRAHVDDAVDLAFNLANGGAEVAHDLAPARGLEVVRHDARRVSTGLDAIPLLDQRRRRSEEPTSELQSLMRISYAVICLKKKTHTTQITNYRTRRHKKTH